MKPTILIDLIIGKRKVRAPMVIPDHAACYRVIQNLKSDQIAVIFGLKTVKDEGYTAVKERCEKESPSSVLSPWLNTDDTPWLAVYPGGASARYATFKLRIVKGSVELVGTYETLAAGVPFAEDYADKIESYEAFLRMLTTPFDEAENIKSRGKAVAEQKAELEKRGIHVAQDK